jgi:hypothetical protein
MRNRSVFAAFMLAAALLPAARAQFTGTIQGRVLDPNEAVVPKATVTLSGPAIQGKKTTVTDDSGAYVFLGLPAGQLLVEATAPGFAEYKSPDLDLRGGMTLTVDVRMKVAGVATTVDVDATAPIIDIANPENKFNISGTFMNQLPLSMRQNWDAVWFMVPGAVTIGRSGPDNNIDPAIHGASERSNVYKMDGMEIGNAFTNQGWTTQFSTEAIQDVYIKTSGPDASTPLGQGGYINVVTKSGGNQFHGTAAFYAQPRSFNWNNIPGGTPADQELYQPDLSVGGPIWKDRTWFYISYRRVYLNTGVPRTAAALANFTTYGFEKPSYDLQERNNRFTSKITHKLAQNHTLSFSYNTDSSLTLNSDSRDQSTIESAIDIHTGGPLYRGGWNWTVTPRLLLSVQYGYRRINGNVDRKGGENPSRTLYLTTTVSGGVPAGQQVLLYAGNRSGAASASLDKRSQHAADVALSYVKDGLAGQHQFDVGMQLKPRSQDQGTTYYPTSGLLDVDEYRQLQPDGSYKFIPFHWIYYSPTSFPFGGTGRIFTLGGYVQDKWRPIPRLTISAGVRFDNQSSHDLFNVNEINTVSVDPRLSVAYSLTKNGRDVVRASWSRVHDAIYVQAAPSFGNITPNRTDVYSTALNGVQDTTRLTPGVFSFPAQFNGLVDPNLHAGYLNEIGLSYTRQLPSRFVMTAGFVRRIFWDNLGTMDKNIIYENGLFKGYKNEAFNALSVPVNLKNNHQIYRDFEFSLNRNVGRLSTFTSYTYQKQVDEGQFAYDSVLGYLNPQSWFRNDKLARPHLFRIAAYYMLPLKFTVSAIYQVQSGAFGGALTKTLPAADPAFGPASITLSNGRVVSNPLASTSRLVGPRSDGQLQLPTVVRLNMRFGKQLRLSERMTLDAACDFFNITNNGDPLFFLNGTNTSLATFGQFSSTTQSPRGAELSVLFRF